MYTLTTKMYSDSIDGSFKQLSIKNVRIRKHITNKNNSTTQKPKAFEASNYTGKEHWTHTQPSSPPKKN